MKCTPCVKTLHDYYPARLESLFIVPKLIGAQQDSQLMSESTHGVAFSERVGRHGLQWSDPFSATDAPISRSSVCDREGIGNACDDPVHASAADTVCDQLGWWRDLGISHAAFPSGPLGFFHSRSLTLREGVARKPLGPLC